MVGSNEEVYSFLPSAATFDPSMIRLKVIVSGSVTYDSIPKVVAKVNVLLEQCGLLMICMWQGSPVGQQYGLGHQWLRFNREYICGSPDSPCMQVTEAEADAFYSVMEVIFRR